MLDDCAARRDPDRERLPRLPGARGPGSSASTRACDRRARASPGRAAAPDRPREPGLRDLHLGLDRPAQGGRDHAPRAVATRLLWMQERRRHRGPTGCWPQTPFSFDVSVCELFVPADRAAGAGRPRPEDALSTWPSIASRAGVTTLTSSRPCCGLPRAAEPGALADSRARRVHLQRRGPVRRPGRRLLRRGARAALFNLYGPTEAPSTSPLRPATRRTRARRAHRTADRQHPHLHPGRAGRAACPSACRASSTSAASGWRAATCNRPELTAERFVPDPFSGEPGARLYQTAISCGTWPTAASSSWAASTTR